MELSIIIVSYNTKQLLIDCINSIVAHTKNLKYEIIVVDNNSNDGSVSEIRRLMKLVKKVQLIENNNNKGFGAANNVGLKRSIGEYVLFLNSDTIVHDNALYGLVHWVKHHKNIGAVTCAIKNTDGSMQGTGGYFPTLAKVFAWMFFLEDIPLLDRLIKPFHPVHNQSFLYSGTSQYTKTKELDWITGACLLIPKSVLDMVGAFDEDYFMYTEEVDLCFRIKKHGYRVWYLPKWAITHLGGSSSTKEFPLLQEYKSVKLFYTKNMPQWQFPLMRLFLKCGALLRIPLFSVLKGKDMGRIYVKAFQLA